MAGCPLCWVECAPVPDALIAGMLLERFCFKALPQQNHWVALSIFFLSDFLLPTDLELNALTPSTLLSFLCHLLK